MVPVYPWGGVMNEGVVFEDSLSGTILNSEILKQFSWRVVGMVFFPILLFSVPVQVAA